MENSTKLSEAITEVDAEEIDDTVVTAETLEAEVEAEAKAIEDAARTQIDETLEFAAFRKKSPQAICDKIFKDFAQQCGVVANTPKFLKLTRIDGAFKLRVQCCLIKTYHPEMNGTKILFLQDTLQTPAILVKETPEDLDKILGTLSVTRMDIEKL